MLRVFPNRFTLVVTSMLKIFSNFLTLTSPLFLPSSIYSSIPFSTVSIFSNFPLIFSNLALISTYYAKCESTLLAIISHVLLCISSTVANYYFILS